MADEQQQEIIKCTNCKKKFFEDGFKVSRLGVRNKTCIECAVRKKASNEKNVCEHGRRKCVCKDCGGTGICEHGRRKNECKDCGGSQMCEHGRRKEQCKDCGGSQICEHGRQKCRCKECGGSQICEHGRRRDICKGCRPPLPILIRSMMSSAKQSDKKCNRYDQTNFIDYSFVENLLDDADMKCCYCACDLQYVEYNATLATIERKDNSIGHIKGNCAIACKKCNNSNVGSRPKLAAEEAAEEAN